MELLDSYLLNLNLTFLGVVSGEVVKF